MPYARLSCSSAAAVSGRMRCIFQICCILMHFQTIGTGSVSYCKTHNCANLQTIRTAINAHRRSVFLSAACRSFVQSSGLYEYLCIRLYIIIAYCFCFCNIRAEKYSLFSAKKATESPGPRPKTPLPFLCNSIRPNRAACQHFFHKRNARELPSQISRA